MAKATTGGPSNANDPAGRAAPQPASPAPDPGPEIPAQGPQGASEAGERHPRPRRQPKRATKEQAVATGTTITAEAEITRAERPSK